MPFDDFLSHATEDKDSIARPLCHELEKLGITVWFDEATLRPGMSLSSEIDAGLAQARYGLVVLSTSFFSKNWPKYELSGLKAREINGEKVILPIWHGVSAKDVLAYSPPLADMLAFNSSRMTIPEIAEDVAHIVSPGQHSKWLVQTARTILQGLDRTEYHGTDYDYWPEGGLRSLYGHLLTFTNYRQFVVNCPLDIWTSGPHTRQELSLASPNAFGHYNPAFVDWLHSNVSFVLASSALVRATQPLFDRYLHRLVAMLYSSYQYLRLNAPLRSTLIADLQQHLSDTSVPPQHYWWMSWVNSEDQPDNPYAILMERLGDSNVASSLVYFWIRRYIDGTAEPFGRLVTEFFSTYSPAGHTNLNTFTDWNLPFTEQK